MKNIVALDELFIWKIRLVFHGTANPGAMEFTGNQLTEDAVGIAPPLLMSENRQKIAHAL